MVNQRKIIVVGEKSPVLFSHHRLLISLISLHACVQILDAFSWLERHLIADRQKPQWKEYAGNEERVGRTKAA